MGLWEARQGNSCTNVFVLLVGVSAGLQHVGWWPRASAAPEHTENPLPHVFFTFFFSLNEEFQELTRRVEVLETGWASIPSDPAHSRLDNLDELYRKMECRVADLEMGGTSLRFGGGVGLLKRDSQRHVMESKAISNQSPLTDDPTAIRQ